MKRYLSLAVLLCAAVLTACDKNAVQDITGTVPGSRIKFFNFGVNAPSVNFYANDRKMTAITSATGVGVDERTSPTDRLDRAASIPASTPGQYTFTGKISATTDKDLAISSIPGTLADGKNYSVYLSGFYNTTTKTVDGFIVEDAYPADVRLHGGVRPIRQRDLELESDDDVREEHDDRNGDRSRGRRCVQDRRRVHRASGWRLRSWNARRGIGNECDQHEPAVSFVTGKSVHDQRAR